LSALSALQMVVLRCDDELMESVAAAIRAHDYRIRAALVATFASTCRSVLGGKVVWPSVTSRY
jgi:hypothetical protein